MRILIVEDEYKLADVIADRLRAENYAVDIATNGEDGEYYALSNSYDLVILDVMLPGINGFDILRHMREENIDAAVIMLTARSAIDDKLQGLTTGANDYLTKPFHMDELVARVAVQLRGPRTGDASDNLSYGDIELCLDKMELAKIGGEGIALSKTEFQLMELLINNRERILSREQIYERIWGYDSEIESNNLEAYLSFLRKKLRSIDSSVGIKAIRGVGYRLEENNEQA